MSIEIALDLLTESGFENEANEIRRDLAPLEVGAVRKLRILSHGRDEQPYLLEGVASLKSIRWEMSNLWAPRRGPDIVRLELEWQSTR